MKIVTPEHIGAVSKLCADLKQAIVETTPKGGPQSPEGKAISARNSAKHGFTSAIAVLPGEDASAYDQLLCDLRLDHRPRTAIEDQCLEQMGTAYWKLRRITALEKALWDHTLEAAPAASPIHKMAAALLNGSNISAALDKLNRYEGEARRLYHQSEATFRRHQKYAAEALAAHREQAATEQGQLAVLALDSIAFLRKREFQEKGFPPTENETNSNQAAETPNSSA